MTADCCGRRKDSRHVDFHTNRTRIQGKHANKQLIVNMSGYTGGPAGSGDPGTPGVFAPRWSQGWFTVPQWSDSMGLSTIRDRVDRKGRGRYAAHGCDHERWYGPVAPLPQMMQDHGNLFTPSFPQYCVPGKVNLFVRTLPDSAWLAENLKAFATFSSAFPEEISIANFLWELRELGTLIPKIAHTYLETVQSGILNVEFGWKPFLSDLKTLGELNERVTQRLEHLREIAGKRTRLGAVSENFYVVGGLADQVESYYKSFQIRVKHLSTRYDWRAGGYVFQNLDYLDGLIGQLRAFSGALGLQNPVKVLWNALPFSFVMDWFFNVSGHLAAATPQPVGWQTSGFTSSVTTTTQLELIVENPNVIGVGFPPRKLGTISYRRYSRVPGLPVGGLTISNLSPRELALLLALGGR